MSLPNPQLEAQAKRASDWLGLVGWHERPPIKGLRPGECVYAVTLTGDALIERDMHAGDLLIFVCGRQYRPGDLCVVRTPDGYTIRFVHPDDAGALVLKPANELLEDMVYPCAAVLLVGVVLNRAGGAMR